jgi:hypothetical protein
VSRGCRNRVKVICARGPKLSFQVDIENIANNVYLIAQESEFTPGQVSIPRLISARVKLRF